MCRALDGLKAQTFPKDQWELLLIDNASKEPLAGRWDLSWHPQARHIREDKLGLASARLRGIEESEAELLLFVDDDNVLAADYCQKLCQIAGRFPQLGCVGAGQIEPEYEITPSPRLTAYLPLLALRTVSKVVWSNTPEDGLIPYGAGLAVRRQIAEKFRHSVRACEFRKLLGRNGDHLNSGEDDEFSWISCELGLGKGLFPELNLAHLIAARRIDKEYLLRVQEGNGFSHTLLNWLHERPIREPSPPPPALKKVIWGFLRGSPSNFFYEGLRWWNGRATDPIEIEFARARDKGIRRAVEMIKQNSGGVTTPISNSSSL